MEWLLWATSGRQLELHWYTHDVPHSPHSSIYQTRPDNLAVYLNCKIVPSLPLPVNVLWAPASTCWLWLLEGSWYLINISVQAYQSTCQTHNMFCCSNKHLRWELSDWTDECAQYRGGNKSSVQIRTFFRTLFPQCLYFCFQISRFCKLIDFFYFFIFFFTFCIEWSQPLSGKITGPYLAHLTHILFHVLWLIIGKRRWSINNDWISLSGEAKHLN